MIPANPAPSGYTVRLQFADFKSSAAGQRKFNVAINEKPVLTDFDIVAEAGGKDKAVMKEFKGVVPGVDGFIRIKFSRGSADNAQINGIEVFPSHS